MEVPVFTKTPRLDGARARSYKGRGLVLALICALFGAAGMAKEKPSVQYQIPLPAPPDFSELDWLVGEWHGKTSLAGSPVSALELTVAYDLDKRVLLLRGKVTLAGTPTVPPASESWMGILTPSPSGTGFTLRVFSSTGFISRYGVTVDGVQVRLNPEGGDHPPPGWLFRRLWQRTGTDGFVETVQAAPPAKPFFDYYTAEFTRLPAAEKHNPAP